MTKMSSALDLRYLPPNDFEVSERASRITELEARASHGCTTGVPVTRLRIADVDPLVLSELRMQHDIAQTTLAFVGNLRHAFDICRWASDRVNLERTVFLGNQQ